VSFRVPVTTQSPVRVVPDTVPTHVDLAQYQMFSKVYTTNQGGFNITVPSRAVWYIHSMIAQTSKDAVVTDRAIQMLITCPSRFGDPNTLLYWATSPIQPAGANAVFLIVRQNISDGDDAPAAGNAHYYRSGPTYPIPPGSIITVAGQGSVNDMLGVQLFIQEVLI